MTPTELKRLYHIIKVQLEYGLDELMPEHQLTKAPLLARKSLFGSKIAIKIKNWAIACV